MLLTINQYDIFHKLFNKVSLFKSTQVDSEYVRLYEIQVKKEYSKSNMNKLLRFLLQQNILKEFILEKEAFMINRKCELRSLDSINPYSNIGSVDTTFSWTEAEASYATNVINWYELLLLVHRRDENMFEVINKVARI